MSIFEKYPQKWLITHIKKRSFIINFMKLPVDGYRKNRKSILYNLQTIFHY